MPIVQLCGIRQKVHPKARCVLNAGPAEFLELFANAAFVFTNSFHGTVFATQFQVPFFTAVSPSELADPESSRTFSLLGQLGLSNRVVGQGGTAGLEDPMDWSAASSRLAQARSAALDYLRAALEDRPYTPPAPERPASSGPRLADHGRCTGCTACQSVCPKDAISMVRDREGFAYPAVDPARCVHCGRCTSVCPPLRERPVHALPAAYAAWNREDAVRKDSTSGGVFTTLAELVLREGGVVYGAAMDAHQHLRHIACFRLEDLCRAAEGACPDVAGDLKELLREQEI